MMRKYLRPLADMVFHIILNFIFFGLCTYIYGYIHLKLDNNIVENALEVKKRC